MLESLFLIFRRGCFFAFGRSYKFCRFWLRCFGSFGTLSTGFLPLEGELLFEPVKATDAAAMVLSEIVSFRPLRLF